MGATSTYKQRIITQDTLAITSAWEESLDANTMDFANKENRVKEAKEVMRTSLEGRAITEPSLTPDMNQIESSANVLMTLLPNTREDAKATIIIERLVELCIDEMEDKIVPHAL